MAKLVQLRTVSLQCPCVASACICRGGMRANWNGLAGVNCSAPTGRCCSHELVRSRVTLRHAQPAKVHALRSMHKREHKLRIARILKVSSSPLFCGAFVAHSVSWPGRWSTQPSAPWHNGSQER